MTISAQQNWKGATTASSVASLTDAYTSNPTAGNACVVFATRELGTGTLSISDDFGDGVSWIPIKGPIAAAGGAAIIIYGWYKVAGTCSAKTVTITNSTNTSLAIYVAEYKSDVAGTWALNGTATSASGTSTTPDPGAITCDSTPSVVFGYQSNDGGTATAVVNWTRQANDLVVSANSVEDRFIASAGSFDPSWTGAPAGSNWSAIGGSLKMVSSTGAPMIFTSSGPGKSPGLASGGSARFDTNWWPYSPPSTASDVTVALTGVEGTGAVGSVTISFDLPPTGVSGTSAVGTVVPGISASITGNTGTGSVGSVSFTNSPALVGVGGTGSVGTVAPLSALPLAGSSATGSVGTLAAAFDIALTGNAGTGAVGTISVGSSSDVTVALSGNQATSAVGSLGLSFDVGLAGLSATGSVGSVSVGTPDTGSNIGDGGRSPHRGFDLKAWKKKQKPLRDLEDDIEALYKEITSPALVEKAEQIVKPFVPLKLRDDVIEANTVAWDKVVQNIRAIEKLHALYEQEIRDDDDDIEEFITLL